MILYFFVLWCISRTYYKSTINKEGKCWVKWNRKRHLISFVKSRFKVIFHCYNPWKYFQAVWKWNIGLKKVKQECSVIIITLTRTNKSHMEQSNQEWTKWNLWKIAFESTSYFLKAVFHKFCLITLSHIVFLIYVMVFPWFFHCFTYRFFRNMTLSMHYYIIPYLKVWFVTKFHIYVKNTNVT